MIIWNQVHCRRHFIFPRCVYNDSRLLTHHEGGSSDSESSCLPPRASINAAVHRRHLTAPFSSPCSSLGLKHEGDQLTWVCFPGHVCHFVWLLKNTKSFIRRQQKKKKLTYFLSPHTKNTPTPFKNVPSGYGKRDNTFFFSFYNLTELVCDKLTSLPQCYWGEMICSRTCLLK